jgi:hypothetical protein
MVGSVVDHVEDYIAAAQAAFAAADEFEIHDLCRGGIAQIIRVSDVPSVEGRLSRA